MADIIRTEELGRCFRTTGGEFWALKNISIQVPEGRLTILKGRSGSGKTTLMNILARWTGRRAAKSSSRSRTSPASTSGEAPASGARRLASCSSLWR